MSFITRTDVTAVKFYNNYVLAGVGNTVHVFDKNSYKFICKQGVLIGQKIYGFVISKCGKIVLVFGGKQFTVVKIKYNEIVGAIVKCFGPVVADDWLHSGIWSGDSVVALLTAHNVVQIWNVFTETLISSHPSKDNSILYSGLLLPLDDGMLVMAGTVFSEVIIHKCGDEKSLHRLTGHKGVIFSITCKPQKKIIVTTSDDRSVRIWGPNNIPEYTNNSIDYWKTIDIVCKHELYGHLARVMRSCITNHYVVSVGEDSAICLWDFEGKLVQKISAHQNGCIWAVDYCDQLLLTGGGDCAVVLRRVATTKDFCDSQVISEDIGNPKKVVLTARRNIVILNDENLIYYNVDSRNTTVYKLNHESTYKLMSLSLCKQLIAIVDMNGKLDIYAENCKNEPVLIKCIDTKLHLEKVMSMHWVDNMHLVFCSDKGVVNVLYAYSVDDTHIYTTFTLPDCKERWLTAAAMNFRTKLFVLGDRCGNVYVYVKGNQNPIQTFSKVHGRYGPTSIIIKDNKIVTTGRDGAIKYFHVQVTSNKFEFMTRKDLEFQWIEKFLDKDERLVCGFRERVFVVYNMKDNCDVFEESCGGGHRSWDAQRCIIKVEDEFEEVIKLVYIKNSGIHLKTYFLNKLKSRNLINGSHSKEINCLKIYKNDFSSKTYYVSGGEDTTLRISSIDDNMTFRDEVVFKQLSSIRTLKLFLIDENNFLIISAGGRAEINIKNIKFTKLNDELQAQDIVDYLVKGTDKDRKGSQSWKNCTVDFDPETRIMDLDIAKQNKDLLIFTGCSDAVLRVFSFNNTFKLIKELRYHKTCILKTHCFRFLGEHVLVTATTRGDVAFWRVDDLKLDDNRPFLEIPTRDNGINSIAIKELDETSIVIATGGDDNSILVQHLKNFRGKLGIDCSWSSSKYHSSQITGVCLVEDLLLTTSIDQRITLFRWILGDGIKCMYITQVYTNVPDVQGMDVLEVLSESIKVCVFGKGMEVVDVPKSNKYR